MTASPTQIGRSVEPGSMEYGQRQAFEQALGGLPTPAAAPMAGETAPDMTGIGIPGNPLDPLMSGALPGGTDPLTSGLSLGPGPGLIAQTQLTDSSVERLRILATEARSPALRRLARASLKSVTRDLRGAE